VRSSQAVAVLIGVLIGLAITFVFLAVIGVL
jgi:hypothetical protein